MIVYDSVSPEKNTEKVAITIRDALVQRNIETEIVHAKDVDISNIESYDYIIVGSPTHAWRPTVPVMDFLDKLTPKAALGKSAAAFDTRVKSIFAGGAADNIESKLKKIGFKIASPSLAVYVRAEGSSAKDMNGRNFKLVEGELDKAKRFAEQLVKPI